MEEGLICAKVRYANEKYANEALKKIRATSSRSKIPTRSYLCNRCKAWHLTSETKTFSQVNEENLALREQLIEQIQENINLKAEIDLLVQFKNIKKK
jgi:hypothetical protein